jgi:hypothetical protein
MLKQRYPFVSADILSSSAKLADAFIEIKKIEVSSPVKESSPGAVMPALVDQSEAEPAKDEGTENDETKAIEDVLKVVIS